MTVVDALPDYRNASHLRELSDEEIKEKLKDPWWRLHNLYWITDKNSNVVLFQPNEVQKRFIRRLWWKNVIPKARQRGFSTVVQILILDACLFRENTQAGVIAQDLSTSHKIFKNKVLFAYERLPRLIQRLVPVKTQTQSSISFANGSELQVSTSVRGGTLDWLHISEYGTITARYPEKADEIQEGSLPAAENGIIVIESTVETPEGEFADMVKRAQAREQLDAPLAKQDYRLHFASWWDADEYEADPERVIISATDHAYFERIEATIGQEIPPKKRAWYVATKANSFNGSDEKMWAQYPSTLEEAFTVSSGGRWYSKQMTRARLDHRITRVLHRTDLPVNTFWDIGDTVAVWFHQLVRPNHHLIRFLEWFGDPYSTIVRDMQGLPYVWGQMHLPWDAYDIPKEGVIRVESTADMLDGLWPEARWIKVPKTENLEEGNQQTRELFSTLIFDEELCAEGIVHLDGYQKVWSQNRGWTNAELRNEHTHAASALRQLAQNLDVVLRGGGAAGPPPKRRRSRPNRGGMAV